MVYCVVKEDKNYIMFSVMMIINCGERVLLINNWKKLKNEYD